MILTLDPRLAADCHRLGRVSDRCHLLLHRNAAVPWFILVPETTLTDLLELPEPGLAALLERARPVADFIRTQLAWPRVNVGALGLVVPQLHLHVVGRSPQDPCWPRPVWGNLSAGPPYDPATVERYRSALIPAADRS
jgi:diadenosine tetraphosphate (Ap4A) HIT family hydrolase